MPTPMVAYIVAIRHGETWFGWVLGVMIDVGTGLVFGGVGGFWDDVLNPPPDDHRQSTP